MALPLLTKDLEFLPEPVRGAGEGQARAAAAEAAIRRIKQVAQTMRDKPGYSEAAARIAELYKRRLDYGNEGDEAAGLQLQVEAERNLRVEAIKAERDELFQMWLSNKLDESVHQRLLRELDLIEGALSRNTQQ